MSFASAASRKLLAGARASEWWGYKMAPLLATAYATASLAARPWGPLLPRLLGLLLAFVVGAVYVSLLNDWTDRADDAASHKVNRLAQVPGGLVAAALAACLASGAALTWYYWQASPAAGLLYLGAWVVYSLYSLPPLRLKVRGGWGLLADTAGAHLLPQLLTAVLVARWAGVALPAGWLAAVGAWAVGCGLRNILWHQLGDAAADRQAGVATYVVRHGEPAARRLAAYAALPLEALALAALLYQGQQPLAGLALALYGFSAWVRARMSWQPVVIAQPQPDQHILLNEFYELYYPLALLLAHSLRWPAEAWILGLHLLLFGAHGWFGFQMLGWSLAVAYGKLRQLLAAGTHRLFK